MLCRKCFVESFSGVPVPEFLLQLLCCCCLLSVTLHPRGCCIKWMSEAIPSQGRVDNCHGIPQEKKKKKSYICGRYFGLRYLKKRQNHHCFQGTFSFSSFTWHKTSCFVCPAAIQWVTLLIQSDWTKANQWDAASTILLMAPKFLLGLSSS